MEVAILRGYEITVDLFFSKNFQLLFCHPCKPKLFTALINGIGEGISSECALFADDCIVDRCVNSQDDVTSLQRDFYRSRNYTPEPEQSKCLVISNKRTPPRPVCNYTINNTTLENVGTFKYLGVLIDTKLKWSAQVNASTAKANQILNLLRRNSSKSIKDPTRPLFVHTWEFCVLCTRVGNNKKRESTQTPHHVFLEQILRSVLRGTAIANSYRNLLELYQTYKIELFGLLRPYYYKQHN